MYTQLHTDSTWPGQIVKKRGRESRRSSLVILSRVSTDGVCEVWSSFFGEILGVKKKGKQNKKKYK
jgi:hypothetical protein